MGLTDDPTVKEKVKKVEIACCSRIGMYNMGRPRPISVTCRQKDDKEHLMTAKRNLPPGIYINHKYPAHSKCARDKLRPVLKLAKSMPHYEDKSRLENDN